MSILRRMGHSIAAIALAGLMAVGCTVTGRTSGYAYYTTSRPPAPRYAQVTHRPGMVYIQGRWVWDGAQWRWSEGRWQRARPQFVYVQGRWVSDGSGWRWREGYWRRSSSYGQRDYERVPARPGNRY